MAVCLGTIMPFKSVIKQIRTISGPVTGGDGLPASGRDVIIIGKNEWAIKGVVALVKSDGSGNYAASVQASSNDRFDVIGIGNTALGEYSDALSNITWVL